MIICEMDVHVDIDHQVSSQKSSNESIVNQPGDKPRVKRKSPSDLKRDKARKLKYLQKMSPLPPAPLFPDDLRLVGTSSVPENRNTMTVSGFSAAPTFPDEFYLKSAPDCDSRYADCIPPAPPFPDEFQFMTTSAGYSGRSDAMRNIPPTPPFPDEFRTMNTSAAVGRDAVWNSMNSCPIYSRNEDEKGAQNQPAYSGFHPPDARQFRTPSKRERDRKRMAEFNAKKKKAMEDHAKAKSSSSSSTLQETGNDSTTRHDDEIPQQQKQTSHSNIQPAESAGQTGQNHKRHSHSACKEGSLESLKIAAGDQHDIKEKNHQDMYTHQDAPGSANTDRQRQEHTEQRSAPYLDWYCDTPAQKTLKTYDRHIQTHYDNSAHYSLHRHCPQERSAQQPAFYGRDHARDANWDQEYYLAIAEFALRDHYMAKFVGNHERAEAAWRDYCSARECFDFESADAASEDCY